jgi:hypothetical protein
VGTGGGFENRENKSFISGINRLSTNFKSIGTVIYNQIFQFLIFYVEIDIEL